MIIKGASRCNRRFFTRHLLHGKDNERVRVVGFRGFARESVDEAFRDMEAAAQGTRCQNYFYHADLSPCADEHLTDEQWDKAVDTLEKHLGFQGQPRFVVEHEKEGKDGVSRVHRHVVWSRIDPDTMTARDDSLTYRKHEAAAREIEQDCGLKPVASVLVKDRKGPRPERRARDWEGFRAAQSGLDWKQVRNEVTARWQQTDNGASFKAALAADGYILCRGDRRDFVIVDPAGDDHSVARRIRGVRAADVAERMKNIDRDFLPSVEEGRAMADAKGDNDAARAVRKGRAKKRVLGFRRMIQRGEMSEAPVQEQAIEQEQISPRARSLVWTPLEKGAQQYGKGVKQVARAGQDAYWQALIGGKPRSDADKLHDLMWEGKTAKQEPEAEQNWKSKLDEEREKDEGLERG